jgi:hypothetical protein
MLPFYSAIYRCRGAANTPNKVADMNKASSPNSFCIVRFLTTATDA